MEVARNLIIAALNESAGGDGTSGLLRAGGSRTSVESVSTSPSGLHRRPSLFLGAAGTVQGTRSSHHPDSERLLVKAALLLRLATLITEAAGDSERLLRTAPPLFGWVFGSKHCALALPNKAGRQLFTWTPAPGSDPAAPLARHRLPVDAEIVDAVQHAMLHADADAMAPSARAIVSPDGIFAPSRGLTVFSQNREHRLILPLIGAAPTGAAAAGKDRPAVDGDSGAGAGGAGGAAATELPPSASGRPILAVLLIRRRVAYSPTELDLIENAGKQLAQFFQTCRKPRVPAPAPAADAAAPAAGATPAAGAETGKKVKGRRKPVAAAAST